MSHLPTSKSRSCNPTRRWVQGSRLAVSAEISSARRTSVYTPRVHGYKPIQPTMEASRDLRLPPPRFPNPNRLPLPVIKRSRYQHTKVNFPPTGGVVPADRAFIASITQPRAIPLKGRSFISPATPRNAICCRNPNSLRSARDAARSSALSESDSA